MWTDCHNPKIRNPLPTGYEMLSDIPSRKSGIKLSVITAETSSTPTRSSLTSLTYSVISISKGRYPPVCSPANWLFTYTTHLKLTLSKAIVVLKASTPGNVHLYHALWRLSSTHRKCGTCTFSHPLDVLVWFISRLPLTVRSSHSPSRV